MTADDGWNDDPDIESYFAAPKRYDPSQYPVEVEYSYRRTLVVMAAMIGAGIVASVFVIVVAVMSL